MNRTDNMVGNVEHARCVTLPVRKRLNHRGPLSIDVSSVWYFVTICADSHAPWVADGAKIGRAVAPRPPHTITSLETIATLILREARKNHVHALWHLALFLVMPDHLHFIVNVGGRGATALPGVESGGHGVDTLPRVIANFKHLLSARYGIRFQRDFFDTRLRDDAHFAEEYDYILGNPVRRGLCATSFDWPYSIAFTRDGTEIPIGRAVASRPPEKVEPLVPQTCEGWAISTKPSTTEIMMGKRNVV